MNGSRLYRRSDRIQDEGEDAWIEEGERRKRCYRPRIDVAAVVDGASEIYKVKPRFVPGPGGTLVSGGGLIICSVEEYIDRLTPSQTAQPLRSIASALNVYVGGKLDAAGYPSYCEDVSQRPGACIAIAKITRSSKEVIVGGDCFAAWQKRNGEVGISHNQLTSQDETIAWHRKQIMANVLHSLWLSGELREHCPEVAEKYSAPGLVKIDELPLSFIEQVARPRFKDVMYAPDGPQANAYRQNVNRPGGYPSLNGDPSFEKYLQHFTFGGDELSLLILGTDGFLPDELGRDSDVDKVAKQVIDLYQRGGLQALRAVAIEWMAKHANGHHTSEVERTARVYEF